jgi:HD-GYP domain-containing protein (c-di-GMP phosphodiesterase class II)
LIKLPVSNVMPGMTIAKDVYLPNGRLLLLAGFAVKPRYIEKMKAFNIEYIYIEENRIIPLEEISEEKIYSEAFNSMKNVLSSVRDGQAINVLAVKSTVEDIVHAVINNESVFMQLTGIRDIDNYTFLHSVDVCIYSVITGRKMGLSKEDLTELGIGAVLHDIGKCKIPHEILNKPAKLTTEEFEKIKLHTLYGYEIICNTQSLNNRIATIACQHHEKWDGSGYPFGLSGTQIDILARIVTAADIYDALTADRVYRKRDLPHEAAEYIVDNSSILLDPEVASIFIKNIAIYPEGSFVLLNSGEIGSVIEVNKSVTLKPKIRVIARREGPPIIQPYEIDLKDHSNIHIIDVLG